MTKTQYIIVTLGVIIGGVLLCGYALTSPLGPIVSNICVAVGLGFVVFGFISLVLRLKK